MRRVVLLALFLLVLMLIGTSLAFARVGQKAASDLAMGAQIYDRWYAALGVPAPDGNMPIWSRQSTNTRSGPDTWRCSECHGWDYRGVDGSYVAGSHKTGFPSLMIVLPDLSKDDIIKHLNGSKDSAHNFSKYLNDAAMQKVALFLKEGVIDDTLYIDPVSLKDKGGNIDHGKQLYQSTCAECHGEDGKKIIFHTEGVDESLGNVSNRDPYRFLHRTRFGVAGTEMPVGYDLGWTPADGRDVLAYSQTLPGAKANEPVGNVSEGVEPAQTVGGARNPISGMFVGIVAALGTIGSALLFLAVFVFIGFVVVFALRRRN